MLLLLCLETGSYFRITKQLQVIQVLNNQTCTLVQEDEVLTWPAWGASFCPQMT